ncbi:Gryzun, putative trafficking through golgi-domain-containing protein [Flagelloscypha sp. PMI_526]|nr:Gryzun, putative trafficking through golgi-domain-containing protein [Flagelloscypha sp. PMI_526]
MNSYPPELLAQLAPVMFVAGLDTGIVSPSSPKLETEGATTPKTPLDQFTRKVAIYQPDKSKTFQVVMVSEDSSFPPRKLPPQDGVAHSPLSPLTASSPLHPDGLIAPIWIRKHTALVPSVFVLFKHPEKDREREQDDRKHDTEVALDIAMRKKSTNERNIKLTVVLLASRKLLDDPGLDSRLTFIRRQSGLDSRAALFVLSPVSQGELVEFVQSLQQALYDPALDYYTNHSKRVRRKRNRHTQAISSYPTPMAPMAGTKTNVARPLRPEGWTVRYEYKMACFAEFRGEDEVALKTPYSMLCIMFGSILILPPRTKEWAEAKVLADCINIKVTKLYLYNNEHALALSHHSAHVRQFGDFSRGWGIGEETFEFWSWVARQHRILAELLEQGTRSTLVLPKHQPSPLTTASSQSNPLIAARSVGINPSHALQHPGFYYYLAAKCTESRKERYEEILKADLEGRLDANTPGFTNEKKVDHTALILELYTKAYELFKKYSSSESQTAGANSRMTLWVANCIARTYDMAVKFFERIAKVYRKEDWGALLQPLLSIWYASAQKLGDVDLSVKLLLERIAQGSEEPDELEEDLLTVLTNTIPADADAILQLKSPESVPFFNTSLAFWGSEQMVGQPAAFQLSLATPSTVSLAQIPFTSLIVQFSDSHLAPLIIEHAPEDAASPVKLLHVGSLSDAEKIAQTNLRWLPNSLLVISGTLSSAGPASITVESIVMRLELKSWKAEIHIEPNTTRFDSFPTPQWLRSLTPPRFIPISRDAATVTFRTRPRAIEVNISHKSPAYLDEAYTISVEVVNTDIEDIRVTLNVLLQPTTVDYAVSSFELAGQTSSGLVQDVSLAQLESFTLLSKGAAGDRILDIAVQTRPASFDPDPDADEEEKDEAQHRADEHTTETVKTVVIPVVDPLKAAFEVAYAGMRGQQSCPSDLALFEGQSWSNADGTEVTIGTQLEFSGPWVVDVHEIKLVLQDNSQVRLLDYPEPSDDDFPSEYHPGDEFSAIARLALAPPEDNETEVVTVHDPGHYAISWQKVFDDGTRGTISTSILPLPPLEPPIDEVIALLSVPAAAHLHTPFTLSISVRNRNTTKSANIFIQIDAEPTDGFIFSGLRSGRLPILLPDSEASVTWRAVPVECGFVKLPKIVVKNLRPTAGTGEDSASGEGVPLKVLRASVPHKTSMKAQADEKVVDIQTLLVLPT